MHDKPKLGEILVRAGVIDEMQLSSALGEQARWGRRLGVTLIKMGMVEEAHLVRALAKQLGLPVASLAGKRIADDVIALVPSRVASEHGVIPLFVKHEGPKPQLFLGMEDPSNLAVLDDLSFRTGMVVRPVMVGPTELGEALDRYYLVSADLKPNASRQSGGGPTGEPIGELNLRRVGKEEAAVGTPSTPMQAATMAPHAGLSPASRDSEIALTDESSGPPPPLLPEGLLEDVAKALDETQKTRLVARALAQLLIEKGVLTLEELQTRIAQQKEGSAG